MSLVESCKSLLEGRYGCDFDLREEPIGLRFRSAFDLSVEECLTPLQIDWGGSGRRPAAGFCTRVQRPH